MSIQNHAGMQPEAKWSITCGDCVSRVDGLPTLPDKSVDHFITDPPYDQHTHGASRIGTSAREAGEGQSYSRNVSLGFDALSRELMAETAREMARVVRRWVIVFCSMEMISGWKDALVSGGLEYIRAGVWVKLDATPQFTGDRPATGTEAIVIAHPKGKKKWNGGGRHAVWTFPIEINRGGNNPRLHTTQKPLSLMEALVRDFTDPGELIADPFTGSGSTGAAALKLGRRFVGWEIDNKYAEVARNRLTFTDEQLPLELAG